MSSIPIYIVTGFLGAGKTTLLKRLVHAVKDNNFLFVINEFSAVDIDVGQIEKEGGVAVGVAGGSVFGRRLISDFVSFLKNVSDGIPVAGQSVKPDGLIIETSSMTDPRSIWKILDENSLGCDFHVAGVTAIVDPGVYMNLLLWLPNIRGQIQCADLVLLNKIDRHLPEIVNRLTDRVRSVNPDARIIQCSYCDVDPAYVLETGNPLLQ